MFETRLPPEPDKILRLMGMFAADPRSDKLATWWTGFNDKYLTQLVEKSRTENLDLQIALERVVEARAQRGVAYSTLFPQAGASGEYTR